MSKKRDALRALERRMNYLEQRIETEEYPGKDYDRAECGALKWALSELENIPEKECPFCHEPIYGYPAISRADNKTEICSNCGLMEALSDMFEHIAKERSKK